MQYALAGFQHDFPVVEGPRSKVRELVIEGTPPGVTEESLRRATELAPDNREYLQALGSFYEREGLSARAKKVLDRARQSAAE